MGKLNKPVSTATEKSSEKKEIATVNRFERWVNEIKPKMADDIQKLKEQMTSEYPDMPKEEARIMAETTTEYLAINKLQKMFEDSLAIMRKYLELKNRKHNKN